MTEAPNHRSCVVLPFVLGALVAACNGGRDERSAVSSLVAAHDDVETRSIVVVRHGPFGALCTGVVVAPRVVLTAKHCVQASGAAAPFSPDSLVVATTLADAAVAADPYVDGGADFGVAVSSVRTTPGAWFDSPSGPIGALRGVDLAVLVLDRAIDVTPATLRFDLAPLAVNDPARVVAMGRSIDGAPGVRRTLDVHVVRVDGSTIATDGAACDGDSGGALFDGANRARAVLSTSPSPCGVDGIEFVSVDVLRDEVTRALEETGAIAEALDGGEAGADVDSPASAAGGCSTRTAATTDPTASILLLATIGFARRRTARRR